MDNQTRYFELGIKGSSIVSTYEVYHDDACIDGVWKTNMTPALTGEYIVSICDDSGDNRYWYTQVATYISNHNIWIKDNEIIPQSYVRAWLDLPKPYKGD